MRHAQEKSEAVNGKDVEKGSRVGLYTLLGKVLLQRGPIPDWLVLCVYTVEHYVSLRVKPRAHLEARRESVANALVAVLV